MIPQASHWQQRPKDLIGNAGCIARIVTGDIEDTTPKQLARLISGLAWDKAPAERLSELNRHEFSDLVAEVSAKK
jgi:hypothetical protein